MSTVTVDIKDLGATLSKLAGKAKSATSAALTSSAQRVRYAVVQRSLHMKSDLGFPGNNTLFYSRAWKTDRVVASSLMDSYIRIFNQAPYAGVLEYGRRAGKMPPPAALVPWVRRKLRVPAKRAPGVAFAIAKKIAKRTIAGRHIVTDPTFVATMGWLFRDEVERVLKKYLTTGKP